MENSNKNAGVENGSSAGTKLERLQLRAKRLQQQAQQARERLREEESAQEKLTKLMERRRIESEQRLLGGLAYIAGLGGFRVRSADSTISPSQPLDADLLIGAMRQLCEQLGTIDDAFEVQDIRLHGALLRKAYYADRGNPRFRIPHAGIPAGTTGGSESC